MPELKYEITEHLGVISESARGWKKEVKDIRENHYPKFGSHLPKELAEQLDILEKNLNK